MAGSASSISARSFVELSKGSKACRVEKISVAWTGDNATGAVPDLTLPGVYGFLMQAVTNPGSTAPTDNYDIVINDADGADLMQGTLANRDTANSELAVPTTPAIAAGDLTVVWTNTSVNSATGTLILYVSDSR